MNNNSRHVPKLRSTLQVLHCICRGMRRQDIATRMRISIWAVDYHVNKALRLLKKRSIAELTVWAFKSGLALALLATPAGAQTKVTLSWSPMTNVDWFFLYGSTDLGGAWSPVTNAPGTNASISLSMAPQRFFFVLTASNFWGEGPTSNVAFTPVPVTNVSNLTIKKN